MMASSRTKSKRRRGYNSTGRRRRAQEQREATLDRAQALFLQHGYTATTVESIAAAARVSAATVYKTYGGKAGLVRALCERALAGAGPVPAHDRSDALRMADDPRFVLVGWGGLLAEVSPRFSPLLLLLRAAAETDREAARLYEELDSERLARMTDNASFLAKSGHLRQGVTLERARDVLWFCSSAEFYKLLVVDRGWSPDELGAFAVSTMTSALL
jgi:AcrR family transcriptional regulator